jgi:hypothetical protein
MLSPERVAADKSAARETVNIPRIEETLQTWDL